MGNSPSTDLGGAELHDRDIEAMDTKGEKSSEVHKLAGTKSKSKDDESLIQKPLQLEPDRHTYSLSFSVRDMSSI